MAVDEALLQDARQNGIPTLRFYAWYPATLSLGYFQPANDRMDHEASRSTPLVRRASGGGAILHDREITYSLTLPKNVVSDYSEECCYQLVHLALQEVLNESDIDFRLAESIAKQEEGARFLCFQRRSCGDGLIGSHKVLGSAQRRVRGALLQHGSLIIERSPFAPELPGVSDLAVLKWSSEQLIQRWSSSIATRLNRQLVPGSLQLAERDIADRVRCAKYSQNTWNLKR